MYTYWIFGSNTASITLTIWLSKIMCLSLCRLRTGYCNGAELLSEREHVGITAAAGDDGGGKRFLVRG